MPVCSFCRAPVQPGASRLCLCRDCLAQLTCLAPDSPRYFWYVSALKRSLFQSEPG